MPTVWRTGYWKRQFNLKTAVDGHKKAQRAQNEKGGVETIVTDPVRVSASAKLSLLCAFCAFSWPTVFSEPNCRKRSQRQAVPIPYRGFLCVLCVLSRLNFF
jgi:hypothetical protein